MDHCHCACASAFRRPPEPTLLLLRTLLNAGNGNILVWKRKAEEYLISQAAVGDLSCA